MPSQSEQKYILFYSTTTFSCKTIFKKIHLKNNKLLLKEPM